MGGGGGIKILFMFPKVHSSGGEECLEFSVISSSIEFLRGSQESTEQDELDSDSRLLRLHLDFHPPSRTGPLTSPSLQPLVFTSLIKGT